MGGGISEGCGETKRRRYSLQTREVADINLLRIAPIRQPCVNTLRHTLWNDLDIDISII